MNSNINGEKKAHIFRRFFHMSMLVIPLLYYYCVEPVFSKKVLHVAILAFIFFIFLFEKFRIRYRLMMFGQRQYEATKISAFGWTMLALGVVLLFSPSLGYSIAIVTSCALIDPLMGELRLHHVKREWIILSGICVGVLIWGVSAWIYHLPHQLILWMPIIAVTAEWRKFKWIDDNALMIIVPLLMILLFFR